MYDDLRAVTVSGGLTQDPELKYTTTGTAVLKLNLGCSESRKNQQGGYDKQSHYFEVTFWAKYAEALSNKLSKGMKVLINGDLTFQQWENNGDKRSKVSITGRFLQILNSQQQDYNNNQQSNNSYQNYQQNNQGGAGGFENDIPFMRIDDNLIIH